MMFNLHIVQTLAGMTTEQLEGARARLVLMSEREPGRDVAIEAIDSELLARAISRYPREKYVKSKGGRHGKSKGRGGSL